MTSRRVTGGTLLESDENVTGSCYTDDMDRSEWVAEVRAALGDDAQAWAEFMAFVQELAAARAARVCDGADLSRK